MTVPKNFLSTLETDFSVAARTGFETALSQAVRTVIQDSRHRERMSIAGSSPGDG